MGRKWQDGFSRIPLLMVVINHDLESPKKLLSLTIDNEANYTLRLIPNFLTN